VGTADARTVCRETESCSSQDGMPDKDIKNGRG